MFNFVTNDFSTSFWRVLGFNKNVNSLKDIMGVAHDRRSFLKESNRFLKDPNSLSVEKFHYQNFKDFIILKQVFQNYPPEINEVIDEIINIGISLKSLLSINYFSNSHISEYKENIINLLSFQVAFISQKLSEKYDISVFEESLSSENIKPFINKVKKLNSLELDKDVGVSLSYVYDEIFPNRETISPDSFNTKISSWKKNKLLPSFYQICTLTALMTRRNKVNIDFIQLLIVRALLHIKKQNNLSENDILLFKRKYYHFKKILNTHSLNKKRLLKYQKRILPIRIQDLRQISNTKTFLEDIYLNKLFNKVSSNKEYKLSVEIDITEVKYLFENQKYDELILYINKVNILDSTLKNEFKRYSYTVYLVIISLKKKDKRLFNKSYKTLLKSVKYFFFMSLDKDRSYKELVVLLENENNLDDCFNIFKKYINNSINEES